MEQKLNKVTDGPIIKTIFALAWPVTVAMFLEFALSTTDYFWLGQIGPTAQDALTSSMIIIWSLFAFLTIISVGLTAIISRYVGANNFEKVKHFIGQGFALAVFLGTTVSILFFVITPILIDFMGASVEVTGLAISYLRIFFATVLAVFLSDTAYAVFRASGDTLTPTKVGGGVVILNLCLDPILIFGWGPIPAMGVVGASIATSFSFVVGMVIILYLLKRGTLGYKIKKLISRKPKFADMFKIAKIGIPMSTQQLVFVAVYWFLIRYVHQFGETAGAAMGAGNRMESFSYLVCYGFSLAASTMVGQNLGANKPERAAKCAWGATALGIGITFIISVIFVSFPELIASVFSDDREVISIASDYLFILGLSQSAMAVEIIIEGAFSGAGDTLPPMMVMIPGALVRIPMAYYLCFTLEWGINGIWWSLTITTLIKAVIIAYWFWKGNWKLKEI